MILSVAALTREAEAPAALTQEAEAPVIAGARVQDLDLLLGLRHLLKQGMASFISVGTVWKLTTIAIGIFGTKEMTLSGSYCRLFSKYFG